MAEPHTASLHAAVPPVGATDKPGRRSMFVSAGAILSAFLASLCCIGPILFVTLGVGAGLASRFEPLRPLFTVLTLGLLAAGFYVVYGRRSTPIPPGGDAGAWTSVHGPGCEVSGSCSRPGNHTGDKIILWTATVLALVFLTFPWWSTLFV